ncbi:glycoside hydrolase family 3 N-terminal domain-containing protein [Nonomuraea endophytica]|uniref:beta-glucosidase n=1 Tax=Nonomuraea endophytica TaxID=714136 RepID=A0A7W8ADS7_9ACTN|nr:glycoside hydrolase family 3 N-terminal domain-containing protein [Nonomuraea endophytica]MBB5084437.1 beta-glucosidase [Nonomuraea endophytica]
MTPHRRRTRFLALLALLGATLLATPAQAAAEPFDVTDFESDTVPAGVYPWGNDAASTPRLTIAAAPERPGAETTNRALNAEYTVSQWGGWSHDLAATQDWAPYSGFSFWVKGTASGQRVFFELKDGGAGAGSAELFESSFTDDTAGWRQIQVPFADFVRRGDYQPGGAPTDGELDLIAMWGYSIRFPSAAGTLVFDDVQVYGTAPPRPVRLSTDAPVYPVNEKGGAEVRVTVTTSDGKPLPADANVTYKTGTGTATPGEDYTPVEGVLAFPAGTASGTAKAFTVRTLGDRQAEVAETIPVVLSGEGVRPPADEPAIVVNAHGLPYLDKRRSVKERVRDLLGRMTPAEKVGQMTQAERGALSKQDDIAEYLLGSLLSGGGSTPSVNTPKGWADMIDAFQLRAQQTRLQVPLIYGVDAVHGHNNVIGATIFPHNVGMGATRDPALVEKSGEITAKEVKATGIPWDFAPCLCVSRDERWGRAYESFGEDPALVGRMAAIVDGLQDHGVLATAKHFVADGGTTYGTSTTGDYTIDQGVFTGTRQELEAIHLAPFVEAIKRGVGSVMPSFSSVGPTKMHAHRELITDVLKGRLGFKGFVISDWAGIDQIPGDYPSDVRTSINAGLDMIMVPYAYQQFVAALTAEVTAGRVTLARVDDAVSRILTQKFRLGLFERPFADRSGLAAVGSPGHRAVARTAAAKSQVLLKNDGAVLPLPRTAKVYVAGSNANDVGNQSGGWTISWQGASGPITPGTTILDGIRGRAAAVTYSADASAPTAGHDVGVVVVGETPYAEGVGDVGRQGRTLELSAADKAAVASVCGAMRCVVVVVSGRPLLLGDLSGVEAVVAAWLPGTEGAGVSDPLFGAVPYTGRLPFTWPASMEQVPINVGDAVYRPMFPYGFGLRTDRARTRLAAVREQLSRGDGLSRAAAAVLGAVLPERHWNADGSVRDSRTVLRALGVAAALLERSRTDTFAHGDALVSVARDLAQAAGHDPAAQALADQALATGDLTGAVKLLGG